jgi:hypothetical protein
MKCFGVTKCLRLGKCNCCNPYKELEDDKDDEDAAKIKSVLTDLRQRQDNERHHAKILVNTSTVEK